MTIVTATAVKESTDSKVGIAFSRANIDTPMVIKLVREEGLFDGSDLRAGMMIVSINGEPMTWSTPKEAATLLREAEGGSEISIETKVMIGTYVKQEVSEKLGISLKNSTAKPGIFISKLAEDSKFKDTELEVGQRVLYINGVACPATTKGAIALVKECDGELTIVATETDLVCPDEQRIEVPVESPKAQAPDEVSEEKKEENPMEMEEVAEEGEEGKKGLLDSMFSACVC
mmetsp:Transcript_29166/g.44889  ORF Transcript_29166/g.44889 Transcript_29166/m.44889 type:complete len:231 (+) Transcript_29166:106-798(+)|eukprot:CAMPEP_0117081904 /NCGR_PEP_ID=MMETSP0472-20121206/57707_1 /TAXON_ID=693140 ORGANISM="Tiarina fusus, Strain LIS" /NCGR_SAMPLE_ID=MMETSP0472 /ASSEMBLY_ACC=CAM_ASM_000603 /LENGTH=230 /DNA_ID=CAMNT_0004809985 /DNA_START=89 /DNA_END=781 /DNA_ORIENTATION=-